MPATDLPWVHPRAAGEPQRLAADSIPPLHPFVPVVGVPLVAGGQPLGVLLLGPRSTTGPYTEGDLALLRALAVPATLAVERADLVARYNRRITELTTLNTLGQALSAYLDPVTIGRIVYEHLQAAIEFDSFFIGYWDDTADQMVYPLAMDEGAPFYIAPSDGTNGLVGWIFSHHEPLIVPDLLADRERFNPDAFGSARRSRAWVGVPLIAEDRIVGVLSLQSYTPNLYTAEHVQFLGTVGNLAARALENGRLFQEREQRIAALSILNEISRQISGNLRVDDLLRTIHQQVGRMLDTTSFYIALYDAATDMLDLRYLVEEGVLQPPQERRLANGLTEWIVRHGTPLHLTHDVPAEVAARGITVFGAMPCSYLGVPLLVGERVIGVMAVQDYAREGVYLADHRDLFSTIAAQAAVVIENATLYERTDTALARRVSELSAIEEIDRQINASLNLDKIIHLVVERAAGATRARAGILALYDAPTETLRILAHVGYPPEIATYYQSHPLPVGNGVVGRAVRAAETQLVRAVAQDPDYITVLPDVVAQLTVLIRREGRVLGLISLESTEADSFTADTVDFIEHLAEHAALAIDNAARYEREREQNRALTRRTTELAAILRLGNTMRADLPLPDVLQQVAEGVTDSLGFRVAILNLVEEEGEDARVVRVAGAGLNPDEWERLGGERRTLEQMLRLMQPQFQISQSYYIPRVGPGLLGGIFYRPDLPENVGPGQWHPDDMLVVPLRGKGGRLVGVLSVDEPIDGRVPTQTTAETLEIFANVAAMAIENARLFSEERRRLQEISALYELGLALTGTLDTAALLTEVARAAAKLMDAHSTTVVVYDPRGGDEQRSVVTYVRAADTVETFRLPGGPEPGGLAETIMQSRAPLMVPDTAHDARVHNSIRERGIRAEVGVPIRIGDQALGALFINADQPRAFTTDEQHLLQVFANQTAVMLENTRLFEIQNRRLVELSTLQELGLTLTTNLDLDNVLRELVLAAMRLLNVDSSSVLLWEQGHEDEYRAVRAYRTGDTIHVGADDIPPPRPHGMTAVIRDTATPMMIADTMQDPRVSAATLAAGFRAVLGVPLRLSDRVLGVCYTNANTPRQFAAHEINLLQIFANQAAGAIENARLFAAQGRRLTEIATLQELSLALAGNLELDTVLTEIARAVLQLLNVDSSTIILMEAWRGDNYRALRGRREGDAIEVVAEESPAPRPGGMTYSILTTAAPLVIADALQDSRVSPTALNAGVRGSLGVPLRIGDRVLGVLYAGSDNPRVFADHEVDLVQIFANQAAVAIENARLFADQGRRLREIATLQELGMGLTATLELDTLLHAILRAVVQLLSVESSGVLLMDEGPDAAFRAVVGLWQDGEFVMVPDVQPPRTGGLGDIVHRSATPVVITDTESDPRVGPVTRARGIRALIGVPLRRGERVLGVLYANSLVTRQFADHEIDLLQIFANQVAVALENARLFEERRVVERRLEAENTRMARELVTARATQQRLLPKMPRDLGSLRLHGVCIPAMEVGGDYFDVLPLPDGRVAIALGDVTGKGTAAVMITAMIKMAILSQIQTDPAPAAVFIALNNLTGEFLHDRLMTFFYGLWNPADNTLRYFNAGHLFP
jgi:GAF domain-containing protein